MPALHKRPRKKSNIHDFGRGLKRNYLDCIRPRLAADSHSAPMKNSSPAYPTALLNDTMK